MDQTTFRLMWKASVAAIKSWVYQPVSTSTTSPFKSYLNLHAIIAKSSTEYIVAGEYALLSNDISRSSDGITWVDGSGGPGSTTGTARTRAIIWTGSRYIAGVNAVAGATQILTSPDGITWTNQTSLNTAWGVAQNVTGLAWNGTTAVAVGSNLVATSTGAGTAWTSRTGSWGVGSSMVIWSATLGLFVVMTTIAGAGQISTSPDGITWTKRTDPWSVGAATSRISVASNEVVGNTTLVAVGINGNVATSADAGVTWTTQTPSWSATTSMSDVAYGNSRFVTSSSSGIVSTSLDNGVTWSAPVTLFNGRSINDITWDGSKFIVVGDDGCIASSADGITWGNFSQAVALSASGTPVRSSANKLIYDGAKFISLSTSSINGAKIISSVNGITWDYVTDLPFISTLTSATSICYNGSTYVVVGSAGTRSFYSTDGVTWNSTTCITGNWKSVSWSSSLNLFVAVGVTGVCQTSPDGITWTTRASLATATTSEQMNSVIWAGLGSTNNKYVAVGNTGKLATSADGITWTNSTGISGTTWGAVDAINDIAWNGKTLAFGLLVAVGANGKIATSVTGTGAWTYNTSLSASAGWGAVAINSVIWDVDKFVAVGANGKVATSSDGLTWTVQTGTAALSSTAWGTTSVLSIASNGTGLWVVGGTSGQIATYS